MELKESKQGNVLVLELVGRLDTSNYAEAEKKIVALLNAGEKYCLIDCSKLDYISSSGLRVLLVTLKKLGQSNGKLVLCCLNDSIAEIFEIAGFNNIFTVEPSLEAGLASF
ncbi:MAG: STAS domain-containing protein [Bacteroidota bacterium]